MSKNRTPTNVRLDDESVATVREKGFDVPELLRQAGDQAAGAHKCPVCGSGVRILTKSKVKQGRPKAAKRVLDF